LERGAKDSHIAGPDAAGNSDNRIRIGGKEMASLKGTKTEKNLLTAFAGESQARNRYSYFASKAKKEG
jgi:hypothetical protein